MLCYVLLSAGVEKAVPEPKSTSGTSISSPPPQGNQQVCVVLQPPLPSLGNRSGSPTHLGSLADNVRPSVPIILAPSPEVNKKTLKPVPVIQEPGTVQNNVETTQPIREDSSPEADTVEEDDNSDVEPSPSPPALPQPTSPPKTAIYDI